MSSEEVQKDIPEAKGQPGTERVTMDVSQGDGGGEGTIDVTQGDGGGERTIDVTQGDGDGEGIDVPDTRGKPHQAPRHRPGAQHTTTEGGEPKEIFTPREFESLYYKKFDSMGRALIINNLSDKEGVSEKLTELKGVLRQLGFKGIYPKRDILKQKAVGDFEFSKLSKADMIALMQEASSEDYTSFHCFFAVILSHGKGGVLECEFDDYHKARDKEHYPQVELTTLQECFKDKMTLNLKPKLFFVQTEKRKEDQEQHDGMGEREGIMTRKIPREADFFTYMYDIMTIPEDPHIFLDTLKTVLERQVRDELDNNRRPMEINKLTICMNIMIEKRLEDLEWEFDDEDFKIPCVASLLTKYMHFNG